MKCETVEEVIKNKVTVLTLSQEELGDIVDALGMHTYQLSTCESRKEDHTRLCKIRDGIRKCYWDAYYKL